MTCLYFDREETLDLGVFSIMFLYSFQHYQLPTHFVYTLTGRKPEHGPRGIWRKPLKPDALSLNWLGVIDLVFVTWVNGSSLVSCRCLILKVIRSPG